jgi:hypothetical protein
VRDMGDAYVLVVGVVAIVFTAIAERVSRATDRMPARVTSVAKGAGTVGANRKVPGQVNTPSSTQDPLGTQPTPTTT